MTGVGRRRADDLPVGRGPTALRDRGGPRTLPRRALETGEPASRRGLETPSRGRRLLGLAALAAGLGVAAFLTVLPRLAPPPPGPAQPLIEVAPATLREVEIVRGEARGRFSRTPSGWVLVAGEGGPAVPVDGDVVEGFLRTLAGLSPLAQFEEPDLAAFGLDPPRGEAVLRDGGELRIALGDRNPPLTALYVQVLPSRAIVLVGSVLRWEFEKLVSLVARETVRPPGEADPPLCR